DPMLAPVLGRFATVLASGEVDMNTILEETARMEGALLPMTPVDEHAPCCEGHE
ncbi:MAG: hypothetical protein HY720_18435, partial [Planctomycetes bacterium]|nr:hypothetical protein [Planctomycetota bacterium]